MSEVILGTEIIGKNGIKLFTRLMDINDTDSVVTVVNWAYRGKEGTNPWATEQGLVDGSRVTPEMLHSELKMDSKLIKLMVVEHIIEESVDGASEATEATTTTTTNTESGNQKRLVIGCVKIERESLESKEAVVGMLSVDPSYQSSGIGSILIRLAEREIQLWGVQESHLHVVNVRDTLINWYNKVGYVTTETTFPFDIEKNVALKEIHFVLLVKNLPLLSK
ncbi:hypothetical protein RB653_005889 [Dictyostelium firmibasis]|uniref:N-acetyltransferase domain-containing protein n=1 Tax=Dictyostelium firmibasis TaxID=79012 RepID=A0AAN7YYK6_9MYCE